MPPFPSLTKTWHSKPYPAIDPSRPELSAKGKVVAITGAGGSIGGATAVAFAQAGATKIALIGRREKPLHETNDKVEKAVLSAEVFIVTGDIAEADSIRGALGNVNQNLGPVDILVCNAGYLATFDTLADADFDEWWKGFEINTKGAFNCTRAILSVAGPKPILVDISTCPIVMPAMPKVSSYIPSKMAATKIYETFAVENPNWQVVHIHPGVVASDINAKSGITALDAAELPAQFIVWACSPEAEWARTGDKLLWCNWDVEELLQRKEELKKPNQLTVTTNGWPFGDGGDDSSSSLKF